MSIQSSGETLDMKVDKGAQLGHYEILAALGKGGMGEVYLARDRRLDRRVALKILPAEFAVDSDRSPAPVLARPNVSSSRRDSPSWRSSCRSRTPR